MEGIDERLLSQLSAQKEEVRKLVEEHQKLERELQRYIAKRFITPQEEMEKKRIQKRKLRIKDELAQMVKEFQAELNQRRKGK